MLQSSAYLLHALHGEWITFGSAREMLSYEEMLTLIDFFALAGTRKLRLGVIDIEIINRSVPPALQVGVALGQTVAIRLQ